MLNQLESLNLNENLLTSIEGNGTWFGGAGAASKTKTEREQNLKRTAARLDH